MVELPMQNRLHFISGLPRAGSTLLAALLRQNPRFSAGMSSPVFSLFRAMLSETSQRNEGTAFIDDAIRKRLLAGVFDAYYHDAAETVIFDTNRGWTYQNARRPRALATTERASNHGRMWDGDPHADSLDERTSAFGYDAVSVPI